MLVLSRKVDEVVCIGPGIRVMAVDIRGDNVRLGIEAPAGVHVDRQEVRDSKVRDGVIDAAAERGDAV